MGDRTQLVGGLGAVLDVAHPVLEAGVCATTEQLLYELSTVVLGAPAAIAAGAVVTRAEASAAHAARTINTFLFVHQNDGPAGDAASIDRPLCVARRKSD